MAQDRYMMYKSFNFRVEINGQAISFSRVSGLEKNTAMQALQEGGLNSRAHYLRNASAGESALTLEYGMADFNVDVTKLEPGRYVPGGVAVMVMDDSSQGVMITYILEGCYIRRVNYGDLNAEDGKLMINQLEIVYNSVKEEK